MSISFANLVRSTISGKYFLKSVAAEHGETATFSADAPDGSPVHVRLATAGAAAAENWESIAAASAAVTHHSLLRYYEAGECPIDGQPYAYLVHEFIQDRVEDALAERALVAEEADMVTRAALAGLGRLHALGYTHRDVRPASIVAASDTVKLTGESVAPLPSEEVEARRAVSSDLLALGETVTELLTRERGPGAAARLPSPFGEFVRATAGTSGCPHPTAEQLLRVLDGHELEEPVAAAPPPAPVPVPSVPAPVAATATVGTPVEEPARRVVERVAPVKERVPSVTEPEGDTPARAAGRRNGTILLAVFGVLVLSLVLWLSRRPKPVPAAAAVPAPVAAPGPAATAPARPAPKAPETHWYVVAAVYGNHAAAAKKADQLTGRRTHASVVPEAGKGRLYYVIVGKADSRKEADQIRRSGATPRGAYVTRLTF